MIQDVVKKWKKRVRRLRFWMNEYVLAFVCFLLVVLVFDKYNYSTQRNLSKTIEKLEKEKMAYVEKIEETRNKLVDIEVNKERYARERYYMHKPNEEILIINQE